MPHRPGLATCFPETATGRVVAVQDGWDSEVFEVDARLVARVPRRPEVAVLARAEARMLPELARALPVSVPIPQEVCWEHGAMLYPRIEGEAFTPELATMAGTDRIVEQFARFLHALRRVPLSLARDAGIPDLAGAAWMEHHAEVADRFATVVVPRLAREHAVPVTAFLTSVPDLLRDTPASLIHGDLGPAHLLCDAEGLRGVIDWGDTCIGDPANDLAWMLFGTPPEVGEGLRAHLGLGEQEIARAHVYHRLGPFYEVEHGIRVGDEGLVDSGRRGVIERVVEAA